MDYDKLSDIWGKHGVFDKLAERYKVQIESEWHWDAIHKELDKKDPDYLVNGYEVEEWEEDPIYGIYIGSVLNMAPSGKYYQPFACSNVTAKEALKDEIYWETLDKVLEEHGLWCQSSEGDALDMLFCKVIEV